MNLHNLTIIDYDDPDAMDNTRFDVEEYKNYSGDYKYHKAFILLAAYYIDGVRFPKEKLSTEFCSIRDKADVLCNFTTDDADASIVIRNIGTEENFEIKLSSNLTISICNMIHTEIRSQGVVYCDFIKLSQFQREELLSQYFTIQRINFKYCVYNGEVWRFGKAIKAREENTNCCVIL